MSQLLIRPNATDVPLLRRLLAPDALRAGFAPDRLVVDAHVAIRKPEVRHLAEQAGIGLLIDPQTYFLQDRQSLADPWVSLPFASSEQLSEFDFNSAFVDNLVRECVEAQVRFGATQIVAPYIHIGHRRQDWRAVQSRIWSTTRQFLDDTHVALPVLAVLSLDWKVQVDVFDGSIGTELRRSLRDLGPVEIALGVSSVTKGKDPAERIEQMLTLIGTLSRTSPVIAWQQGVLGELCVAGDAAGYETGIGTREAYDVSAVLASHRKYGASSPRSARPVYIRPLQRSIPKSSVAALAEIPRIWPLIFCHDDQCCEPEGRTMLADARHHAVIARKRALQSLDIIPNSEWQWRHLANRAERGVELAARINRIGTSDPRVKNVPSGPLVAAQTVARRRAVRRIQATA